MRQNETVDDGILDVTLTEEIDAWKARCALRGHSLLVRLIPTDSINKIEHMIINE